MKLISWINKNSLHQAFAVGRWWWTSLENLIGKFTAKFFTKSILAQMTPRVNVKGGTNEWASINGQRSLGCTNLTNFSSPTLITTALLTINKYLTATNNAWSPRFIWSYLPEPARTNKLNSCQLWQSNCLTKLISGSNNSNSVVGIKLEELSTLLCFFASRPGVLITLNQNARG